MILHTLIINGESRTPAGWGIDDESLQLVRASFLADTLAWSMTTTDVLAEPPFVFDDTVEYFQDGVRRFSGWIREAKFDGAAGEEVRRYVAKNAWHELECMTYTQPRAEATAADSYVIHVGANTPQVILGFRLNALLTAEKITTKNQMTDLLDFAINLGLAIAYDVNFSDLTPPYEERTNITVAAAMRAMASLTPDCISWLDYTVTPVKIYIRRRATETPITIDLTAGAPLHSFKGLTSLDDLVPTGVKLTVVDSVVNSADSHIYAGFTTQFAGVAGSTSRLFTGLVNLRGTLSGSPEASPADLASAYYAALQEKFYETTLTFVNSATTYRPGNLLNFSNGPAAWATAKAIVQSVTETPVKGLMVVACGRPPMLNQATWADLNRQISNGTDPGTLASFTSGTNQTAQTPTYAGGYTVPANLECEVKEANYAMIGFSEWSTPSTPPKKYLTLTAAGVDSEQKFSGSGCGGSGLSVSCTHSGNRTYNPADGTYADTGGFTCTDGSNGGVTVDLASSCDYAVTSTQAVKLAICAGSCCDVLGNSYRNTGCGLTLTLSSEDTEDAAIARAGGSFAPGLGASGCERGPATRTLRGPGVFTGTVREKRVRAHWSANPSSSYTITYTFGRRPNGSAGAYAAISQTVHTVVADAGDETDAWTDVPNVGGFETECIGLTIDLVP